MHMVLHFSVPGLEDQMKGLLDPLLLSFTCWLVCWPVDKYGSPNGGSSCSAQG